MSDQPAPNVEWPGGSFDWPPEPVDFSDPVEAWNRLLGGELGRYALLLLLDLVTLQRLHDDDGARMESAQRLATTLYRYPYGLERRRLGDHVKAMIRKEISRRVVSRTVRMPLSNSRPSGRRGPGGRMGDIPCEEEGIPPINFRAELEAAMRAAIFLASFEVGYYPAEDQRTKNLVRETITEELLEDITGWGRKEYRHKKREGARFVPLGVEDDSGPDPFTRGASNETKMRAWTDYDPEPATHSPPKFQTPSTPAPAFGSDALAVRDELQRIRSRCSRQDTILVYLVDRSGFSLGEVADYQRRSYTGAKRAIERARSRLGYRLRKKKSKGCR